MKKFISVLLILVLCAASGCAGAEVKISALKGPTAMGMVGMMDDPDYSFTVSAAIDEITPRLLKGECDIAAVPANMAAVLYNNTQGKIRVLALNTLGVLYIVTNGDAGISCAEDLRGRTLYASGKGATPEYALNYILNGYGLIPGTDIQVEYKSEHSECLASLLAHPGSAALLPQPFVTTAQLKQPDVQIALDLNELWAGLQTGEEQSALLTGAAVVRTEALEEKPEEILAFLNDYRASVQYVQENTAEAAALTGRYDIVPEAVALKALPYCGIVCITGEEMKTMLSGYLQVLLAQEPASIGGTLPDEAFYWIP